MIISSIPTMIEMLMAAETTTVLTKIS